MAANFNLILDTTGPQGVGGTLNAGALYTNDPVVALAATTTDPNTTGYQIKVWGDVDPAADPNVQTTEAASSWVAYTPEVPVTLASGDGVKTLTWRLRDDVWNPSATATDAISLNTSAPTVTLDSGPAPTKISKIALPDPGKDKSSVTWHASEDYQAYSVRVVPAVNSGHTEGSAIPTTGGSQNVGGGAGTGATQVTTLIRGADLETAGAEGNNIVKVFVQDLAGNWSA